MVNVAVNMKMCVNVSPDDFSEGGCLEMFCTVLCVAGFSLWFCLFINTGNNLEMKYNASRMSEGHGKHGSTPSRVKSSEHIR